jgi:hypothetical protein
MLHNICGFGIGYLTGRLRGLQEAKKRPFPSKSACRTRDWQAAWQQYTSQLILWLPSPAPSSACGIICQGQPWLICTAGGQDHHYIQDDFRHELALYTDGLLFTGCTISDWRKASKIIKDAD